MTGTGLHLHLLLLYAVEAKVGRGKKRIDDFGKVGALAKVSLGSSTANEDILYLFTNITPSRWPFKHKLRLPSSYSKR